MSESAIRYLDPNQDEPWTYKPACWEQATILGMELTCERPLGHPGDHGCGPFIDYTTTWPNQEANQ